LQEKQKLLAASMLRCRYRTGAYSS